MIREQCLVCDSKCLKEIIDLGNHPFADTFIPASRISEPDIIYPLVCDLCTECGHVQTKYKTNPLERYSQIEYSYTSSNSNFSRTHWDDYAKNISESIKLNRGSLVIEIGSNDGYLSEQFLKRGNTVLGVDPSPYMAKLAKERNVQTIVDLFGQKVADQILSNHGKADLVIANNVYNHADNPLEFTKAIHSILNKGGSFIFEQPYWLIGLKSGKFDQIYHEHVSYYTVKSASTLLERAGLGIKSAEVVDYHGGSLRIFAQRKEDLVKESDEARRMIQEEISYGSFNLETYKGFMKNNLSTRNNFLQKLLEIKKGENPIIAVGAAAKGNTFLNFYRLDKTLVDYVTDSSPHKKGKYTPATRIPIVGDEIFAKYEKPYALILSWNIAAQLKEKLAPINPNITFISPESN